MNESQRQLAQMVFLTLMMFVIPVITSYSKNPLWSDGLKFLFVVCLCVGMSVISNIIDGPFSWAGLLRHTTLLYTGAAGVFHVFFKWFGVDRRIHGHVERRRRQPK